MPNSKKGPSGEERDLIIIRLEAQSPELHFASGDDFQDFSRDEMIKQIKDNTEAGKEFVETELEFLRAAKDGSLNELLRDGDE